MTAQSLVPTAEAAYIARLTDKQIQRVVDEHILAAPLVQQGNGRRFSKLAAAFAKFYFDWEATLTASARKDIIEQLTKRVMKRADATDVLALAVSPSEVNWDIVLEVASMKCHFTLVTVISDAQFRASQVEQAHRTIVEDETVLGGVPVFKGTRVPIDNVLAMVRSGRNFAELKGDYPFLTPQLLAAAETYQAVHPKRGRPVRAGQPPAEWRLRSRKTVRLASREP